MDPFDFELLNQALLYTVVFNQNWKQISPGGTVWKLSDAKVTWIIVTLAVYPRLGLNCDISYFFP